jgi:hypothetical protein
MPKIIELDRDTSTVEYAVVEPNVPDAYVVVSVQDGARPWYECHTCPSVGAEACRHSRAVLAHRIAERTR